MKAIIALVSALLITGSSCYPQSAKRKITPADFDKWGTLSGESISPDGKWVSFQMVYENENDTLFVLNTKNKTRFTFPKARSADFATKSNAVLIHGDKGELIEMNLRSFEKRVFDNVMSAKYTPDGKFLCILQNAGKENLLSISDVTGKLLREFKEVTEFAIAPTNDLAIISNDTLLIYNPARPVVPRKIFYKDSCHINKVSWSRSGQSLVAYLDSNDGNGDRKILYYNENRSQTKTLDKSQTVFDHRKYRITDFSMLVSEESVYFTIAQDSVVMPSKIVEVWDSKSPLEYPAQKFLEDPVNSALVAVWNIKSNTTIKLDNEPGVHSKVIPGDKYYISFSELRYTPSWAEVPPTDYYITSLSEGNPHLLAENVDATSRVVNVSPSGTYLSWFKEGCYWMHDTNTNKTWNATANTTFYDPEDDTAQKNYGYVAAGWTLDEKYLIVYDQFDVWLISPDGESLGKITNGRESGIRFRIVRSLYEKRQGNLFESYRPEFNLEKGLILSAFGKDKSSGYYRFTAKKGLEKIVYKGAKLDRIKKAADTDTYIYVEQTEQLPPRIIILDNLSASPREIFQTNPHYSKFEWPRSELITYKNNKGEPLQGILMYPSNYKSGKKYPMIVYVYQTFSNTLHEYINPTTRERTGFNPTNYLLDEYFVLFPDIKYKIGEPGPSAVDCVTSAVKEVLSMNVVDDKRMGLIGHSFGGYESSFIITQTQMFAAAVAGSAITDLSSHYFSMNFATNRSYGWSIESQQLRIGSSPFENPQAYLANSPITNASRITTPLLSYTGKDDNSVDFEQSIELHLALRRLHKPNILLLYPGQGHILFSADAQLDLTTRIKDFFNYYLKTDTN